MERGVRPRIVMIGAGNVATHLAITLAKSADVIQVFSDHIDNAENLANAIPMATAIDNIDDMDNTADCYIISIKDDAISQFLSKIKPNNALWVHTSGSVPASVFVGRAEKYGVMYPLQTFTRNVPVDVAQIPFFIEGNSPEVSNEIRQLAQLMSPIVHEADSDKRKLLHIAAVFACNYANHLWAIADDILGKADLPFSTLLPLIRATIEKAASTSPSEGQTGPARRGDTNIIDSHLKMLSEPEADIYRLLADCIINKYNSASK